jgi:hypothetical protein
MVKKFVSSRNYESVQILLKIGITAHFNGASLVFLLAARHSPQVVSALARSAGCHVLFSPGERGEWKSTKKGYNRFIE